MRFPNRKLRTAVDGEDSGVSAHFKNPFVHELRFTPLQKLKVRELYRCAKTRLFNFSLFAECKHFHVARFDFNVSIRLVVVSMQVCIVTSRFC